MIGGPDITNGSGGGSFSVTSSNDNEQDYTTHETDPMRDPIFSGGKTGSETMAEGGSASSVVTSDPNASSLEGKMEQDGVGATVETFKNLASDGDDGDSGPTFDHVPNTEQGKSALKDTAEALASAASSATPSEAEQAANNADRANNAQNSSQTTVTAAGGSGPDGILGAILAFVRSLLAGLFGGA